MFWIKILKYVLSLFKKVLVAIQFCFYFIKTHHINTKLFIKVVLCKEHTFLDVLSFSKKFIYESVEQSKSKTV